jgi:integrase
MAKALTRLGIEAANKPGRFADGGCKSLYLQVSPKPGGGVTRSFLYRYSYGGRGRDMGLGSASTTSLADARQAVHDFRKLLREGQDPITVRQRNKASALAAATIPTQTFQQATLAWTAVKASGWKNGARDAATALSPIRRHLFPVIGKLDVRDIRHDHMVRALGPLMRAHPNTGSLVRMRAEAILASAAAHGYRDPDQANPARREVLQHALPSNSAPVQHYAAPKLDDAPGIFQKVAAKDDSIHNAVAWLVLTTTRLNETLGARWDEIDRERGVWTVPPKRMKKPREHVVPLTSRMTAILDRQAERRCGPFIFPGRHPSQPMNPSTARNVLMRIGGTGITLHGWRSCWRDWCGEHGRIDREVAEVQLAHDFGDATERAYRRGTSLALRLAALERYGSWLAGEAEAEVIPFPLRAAP